MMNVKIDVTFFVVLKSLLSFLLNFISTICLSWKKTIPILK